MPKDRKEWADKVMKEGLLLLHFKHELDEPENKGKYVYQLLTLAKHTETGEMMAVYKHIPTDLVYVRPYDMFVSEVDHEKYPVIKQKYRFEVLTLDKLKGK